VSCVSRACLAVRPPARGRARELSTTVCSGAESLCGGGGERRREEGGGGRITGWDGMACEGLLQPLGGGQGGMHIPH